MLAKRIIIYYNQRSKTRAFLDLSIGKPKSALYRGFWERESVVPLQNGDMAVRVKYLKACLTQQICAGTQIDGVWQNGG